MEGGDGRIAIDFCKKDVKRGILWCLSKTNDKKVTFFGKIFISSQQNFQNAENIRKNYLKDIH